MDCSLYLPQDLPFIVGGGEPSKCVKTADDMLKWLRSQAFYDLAWFINQVSTAIQGMQLSDEIFVSEQMSKILTIFDTLEEYLNQTPPAKQEKAFGNKAYRTWASLKNRNIFVVMSNALPQEKCEYFSEMGYYLSESFGNMLTIEYGTGHELSFMFFMCALFKAEILTEEDMPACGLRLFSTYLKLIQNLQRMYKMESIGSQGVWSLDDYHFIPFIWGSAQLAMDSPFPPAKFFEPEIIQEFKHEYMFMSCIDYICSTKTGHCAEHSNQLWSITAVPTWSKLNAGLVKMYQREILAKFSVIKQVYFGNLMRYEPVKQGSIMPSVRLGFRPPLVKVVLEPLASESTLADTDTSEVLPVSTSNGESTMSPSMEECVLETSEM